jgi:two-component system response regulator NreC
MTAIKVLVADDHRIIREGLCNLLNGFQDMEVVGQAENGRRAVQLAKELRPDVVIMDITMPDLNGIDATRQIRAELPGVKVVALSMHPHEQFIKGILMAGASGYLLKDCSIEEMVMAVRSATRGHMYLSPGVAGHIVKDYLRLAEPSVPNSKPLTPREREVLQLVTEGVTSKEISTRLNLSIKTVDTHRRQIMAKLGVANVADLTKYAIRMGITSVDA